MQNKEQAYDIINNDFPTESFCSMPWNSAAVGPDGVVVPCCRWNNREETKQAPHISNGLHNALNSDFFKNIRKEMLAGKYPSGCNKCWQQEKRNISWYRAGHHAHYVVDSPYKEHEYTEDAHPLRFLETGLGNHCNLSCVMCNGASSSLFYTIKNPGVKVPNGYQENIENIDVNFNELMAIKIVGGEPMFDKTHEPFISSIINKTNNPENIVLHYHTNGTIFPSEKILNMWNLCKRIDLFFSIDDVREHAYNQRPGNYKWELIESNIEKYVEIKKEIPHIELLINATVSALTIRRLPKLLDWAERKGISLHRFNLGEVAGNPHLHPKNIKKEIKEKILEEFNEYKLTCNKDAKSVIEIAEKILKLENDFETSKERILEQEKSKRIFKHYNIDLRNIEL